MQATARLYLALLLMTTLSACGLHLRGPSEIPFKTVFIEGNTLVISQSLQQSLTTSNIEIVDSPKKAELRLELVGEENEKRILSIGDQGTVNEYELYYRVHYRTKLTGQATWSQINTVESRLDYTYSDASLLAKQKEEKGLNKGMRQDVVNNMMRRLTALKKKTQ